MEFVFVCCCVDEFNWASFSVQNETGNENWYAIFDVVTPVVMKISILSDITPCRQLEGNGRFERTCVYHQGCRNKKPV
jgi:hypothetical protein